MMKRNNFKISGCLEKILVVLILFLAISVKAQSVEIEEQPNLEEKDIPQLLPYVPGEVIVKFKEGVEPQNVLKKVGIESPSIKRVHSIEEAVIKFKKEIKLERTPSGLYALQGKEYQRIEDIPDEEFFKEVYNKMDLLGKALYRTYKIKLTGQVTIEEVVADLKGDPDVEYVEPNYIARTLYVPVDPLYSQQWSHQNTQAESGWGIERGNSNVIIAVVDTGVDYNHEDLQANIWKDGQSNPGKDFVDIDTAYYQSHGYQLIPSEDYTVIDNDPSDYNGHGTHVAGIAGAVGGNGIGVAGVAHSCKIMPVRAGFSIIYYGQEYGILEYDDVANGIRYAADNGARMINMSFGGSPAQVEKDAIDYAYANGVVLIASAGNGGRTNPVISYPAAYENVMAVAATAEDDSLAYYSSYSSHSIFLDVAAPGGDNYIDTMILSTVPKTGGYLTDPSGYRALQGTSMASPYVSGLAGLIISLDSTLTNVEVRDIIRTSADDIGAPGVDKYFGYGRVSVYEACALALETVYISSPAENSFIRGSVDISGSAFVNGFLRYELYYAPKDNPQNTTPINSSTIPVQNGLLGIWDTAGLPDGKYILSLKVIDTAGREFTIFTNLTVDNINQPHSFNLPNKAAVIGRLLEFKVEATDPDDPQPPWGKLEYQAANLPPGAQFDPVTQIFSWQPLQSDKGTYEVTFTAKDSQYTVSQRILVFTINIEEIPIVLDTNDSHWGRYPAIYGDKIVWEDWRNGSYNIDIYMYDLTANKEVQITAQTNNQLYPDIYEDKIVWTDWRNGNTDIYMYNLTSGQEVRITTDAKGQGSPAIHQDKIVWVDERNGWYDYRGRLHNSEIYMYNLTTGQEIRLTNDIGEQHQLAPVIYQDKVVWEEYELGWPFNPDIYMYDLSTSEKIPICATPYDQYNPDIHQDKIVWDDDRNRNDDIYVYDLSTSKETRITTDPDTQFRPQIHQDKIVWEDNRTGNTDIFMYDLSTGIEIQITTNSGYQGTPVIYQNKIAWHDERRGYLKPDIYMARVDFAPYIISANPTAVSLGSIITITGNYFGDTQVDSNVIFENGAICPIQSWSNTKITCTVPQNAQTGLIKVVTSGGKSNGIFVTIVNQPPQLTLPFTAKTIGEGDYLKFNISATDPESDPLIFSASNLPYGANFVDNRNGTATFSWTPTYAQAGSYTVHFEVSDGASSDSGDVTITVRNVLVRGRVYGEYGVPLASATVSILNQAKTQTLAKTYTDSQGKFSIISSNIVDGNYYLQVTKYQYRPYLSTITLNNNQVLTVSITLIKDLTPPSTPIVTDGGQYTSKNYQLYASWSSQDNESGVVEYKYTILEGSTSSTAPIIRNWTSTGKNSYVTATSLSLKEGKTYYFGVRAKNGALLWSQSGYSNGITVDITPPVTAHTITGSATVTLTATDNISGVRYTFYSINNSPYIKYTGLFTLTPGNYTIRYYSQDFAGNKESVKSFTIKVY